MLRSVLLACCACIVPLSAAEVLTQHNDNARTGANRAETALTPASVRTATFGKLFTLTLDANVNGQVLYVHELVIGGRSRNVIFAYTSNGTNNSPCSIAAYDADAEGPPLWKHPLPPGAQYTTCTPAIDAAAATIYLVSKERNDDGANRLHALDILTGAERPGSPLQIAGSVAGNGAGSVDGKLSFPATHANCRAGLLVEQGLVYVAFAFNTDVHPYHGWVFCYAYDGAAFAQRGVFCVTPDADDGKPSNYSRDGGGIWQAGNGLVSDGAAVYCTTGNGNFSAAEGGHNYSMCFLKLGLGDLRVLDWFAEAKARKDSDADSDLGNVGPVLIPDTGVLFAGATKYGRSHLVDSAKMGHFTEDKDACLQTIDSPAPPFPSGQNPVAWKAGDAGTFVYVWNFGSAVAQYRYDAQTRTLVGGAPIKTGLSGAGGGGGLAVTSSGDNGGILWCLGTDGVVHALDATDIATELWNSKQNAERDAIGRGGKWQFPTVAGGKAYVPTGDKKLAVYGLLPH